MGVVLGRNVYVYAGASGSNPIIAGAKSCTVSRKCDTIEIASATSPTAREYLSGRTEWDVSISHLVATSAPFEALFKVGVTYTLSLVIAGVRKTGRAICVSAELGGAVGNLATGSAKFKGTGDLS